MRRSVKRVTTQAKKATQNHRKGMMAGIIAAAAAIIAAIKAYPALKSSPKVNELAHQTRDLGPSFLQRRRRESAQVAV